MSVCTVEANLKKCTCTYPCEKRGKCCACIAYHRAHGELPACYFNAEYEKTYDRSIANYLRMKGRS
ncbi:MAG: DUF6485 family protein [Treponemataceae bacterium]|nr:DUF6485 family protein [Treponemataceae bacterium]